MTPSITLRRLSFLTPGSFPADDPAKGLHDTLRLIEIGEELGYDRAWVRQRHLENSISSAATILAAATQRTFAIGLGTAVIQMGYEDPFRLAEDLATVDLLSGGRLQVGLSASRPEHADLLGSRFQRGGSANDPYRSIEVLRANLAGDLLGPDDMFVTSAGGRVRPAIRPTAPGLTDRLWLGAGSAHSAEWAAAQDLNLLIGNINVAGQALGFTQTQLDHVARFRARSRRDIAVGRVVLPLNGASLATRRRYRAFAAERYPRTLGQQGERRMQFAPDLVGSAEQIVEALLGDPVLAHAQELRIELPYNFDFDDYAQIIGDIARDIAPFLGWAPSGRSWERQEPPGNVRPLRRRR